MQRCEIEFNRAAESATVSKGRRSCRRSVGQVGWKRAQRQARRFSNIEAIAKNGQLNDRIALGGTSGSGRPCCRDCRRAGRNSRRVFEAFGPWRHQFRCHTRRQPRRTWPPSCVYLALTVKFPQCLITLVTFIVSRSPMISRFAHSQMVDLPSSPVQILTHRIIVALL